MTKTEQAIREQLRDQFAMAALGALLINNRFDGYPEEYASHAYMYADAMLEARDK